MSRASHRFHREAVRLVHGTQQLLSALVDTIAPARCLYCLHENTWLCPSCESHLLTIPYTPRCFVCQTADARGRTCELCRDRTPLAGLHTLGRSRAAWLHRSLHWLRAKGLRDAAYPLARLLTPRLLTIASLAHLQRNALLVPVPLHPGRLRQRGFNQSKELADQLTALTQIPTVSLLTRHRATAPQTELPTTMRRLNLQSAFTFTPQPALTDKTLIILIDDVITTGATLEAAARTLQPHTPAALWGLTLARG